MDNLITTTELQERFGHSNTTIIKKLEANGFKSELVYVDSHICKAWTPEAVEWFKNYCEEEKTRTLPIVEYAKEMNVSVEIFRNAMKNLGLFSAYKTNRNEALEKEVRRLVEEDKSAMYESHPLVTDKRFFKMSYWPNTVPSCFEDLDEDIV